MKAELDGEMAAVRRANTELLAERDEAQAQMAAMADILQVINSSPGDLAPVFDRMLDKAMHFCDAAFGMLNTYDGEKFLTAAVRGVPAKYAEFRRSNPPTYGPGTSPARLLAGERSVHVLDIKAEDIYREGDPNRRALVDLGGARTILAVPLLKNGTVLGMFAIYRQEVRAFSKKQIALLQNFAAQAVIALENARLFDEVQAKTRDLEEALQQQTATADVLQVIGNSVSDTAPVFDKILEGCGRLFNGSDMIVFLVEDDESLKIGSIQGPNLDRVERIRRLFPRPLTGTATEQAIRERRLMTFADVFNDPGVPDGLRLVAAEVGENYSVAIAPMVREDQAIGAILVSRSEPPRSFDTAEQRLLQTFADQAVIAIQNAALFNEAKARTRELSQSLDELRAAQDRLVQTEKLASLGQLTAGIAHEIKNPLNFVNNFSELSAELTDELNGVLKPVALDLKIREEVDELTGMLKENLEKVVQHGKRADSIVKNMLLHSREGSGELRPTDINSLLDESLNLAYHGARAEKPQFNITLQRDFDETAGWVDVFPQEITRAFLNLISNGFYAATKRKTENRGSDFEPELRATTKNLGNTVEIRIRDNGAGIPPEVKEKMFNPFFTTKPAGEGTGLGLSISHDIVVKQHGGKIDVETEPGQFTEFTIVLARTSNPANKSKS